MDRYERNGIISHEEQQQLANMKVCVVGCGGLGGYVIEMLTRFGVGSMTVVDGDVFTESNLNRQLLCVTQSLGKSKAFTAEERIALINETTEVNVVSTYIDRENAKDILQGHDLVMDALDSNAVRFIVLEACAALNIPFIHGAIAGWYGQVCTVLPEDQFMRAFLSRAKAKGIEKTIGNPSFTPACIASYQVSEAIKVLLNKGSILQEKMLCIDLLNNEFEVIQPMEEREND